MKNLVVLAAVFLFTFTATAQDEAFIEGSGKTIKDKRMVTEFDKISVNGPFDIILTGEATGTIEVQGSDNITGLIATEVKDGTLEIAVKKGNRFKPSRYNKITIRVPFIILNEISLNGSGSITSNKKISTSAKVKLNGSGSIVLSIYSPQTEAVLIGSGSIVLTGSSENFSCKLTGSGSVRAIELESTIVDALVNGSGSVKVSSSKAITGRINGSGSIAFAGHPEGQDLKRTGSGDFKSL